MKKIDCHKTQIHYRILFSITIVKNRFVFKNFFYFLKVHNEWFVFKYNSFFSKNETIVYREKNNKETKNYIFLSLLKTINNPSICRVEYPIHDEIINSKIS